MQEVGARRTRHRQRRAQSASFPILPLEPAHDSWGEKVQDGDHLVADCGREVDRGEADYRRVYAIGKCMGDGVGSPCSGPTAAGLILLYKLRDLCQAFSCPNNSCPFNWMERLHSIGKGAYVLELSSKFRGACARGGEREGAVWWLALVFKQGGYVST